MTSMNRTPVIAVFGGTGAKAEDLESADWLGYQIAEQRCVLLTGANYYDTTAIADHVDKEEEPTRARSTVKDAAIFGSNRRFKLREPGAPAAAHWVGVERTKWRQGLDQDRYGRWMVLRPGYGHIRNYFEASMCDVAIALVGGNGTASEIAFCLALNRPVIIVDPKWIDICPGRSETQEQERQALERLRVAALEGIRGQKDPVDLVRRVKDGLDQMALGKGLPTREFRSVGRADEAALVVTHARQMVHADLPHGTPPQRREYQAMASAYLAWLSQVDQRSVP